MFIREKKNKSGSISIQIIDKSNGYKVVETLGCSSDPLEIKRLKIRANKLISSHFENQLSFFEDGGQDLILASSISSQDVIAIGPELIFGRIFDKIGFNLIPEELFRHITIARLVYPTSKLKTIDYLRSYRGIELSVQSLYRFLDRFHNRFKELAEEVAFNHTKRLLGGKISVVFYDLTSLYFESEDEDDLRKIGFSKDGKFQCPQILIGLLVGYDGYPIAYNIFEGNTFEGHTLIPILRDFEKKYDIDKPIMVADAALLSNKNLTVLSDSNYEYIIGARTKNESEEVKKEILKKAKTLGDGESFYIDKGGGLRLIVGYSIKRAKKDASNRNKGLKRLRKKISSGRLTKESINNRGYNKFLKIKEKVEVSIDEIKVKEDERWDGLKGYLTNSGLPLPDVIDNYKHLWQIEKAFRISKTDLRIRPVYHYRKRRIEAHICISFVAYAIYKELERILKQNGCTYSPTKVAELSKTMYQLEYKKFGTDESKNILLKMNEQQNAILSIISEI